MFLLFVFLFITASTFFVAHVKFSVASKNLFLVFLVVGFSSSVYSQEKAYVVFTKDGKPSSYSEMMNKCGNVNVVFFGELHDNPIAHWLEFEMLKQLAKERNNKVMVGAEMFEADDQIVLDEFLNGKISEKSFTAETKLWPNYKTDYKPLVDYCKASKIPFIATNVPRRYASMVYLKGVASLDSLSNAAKAFLPPLPYPYDGELKCYKEIFSGAGHGGANLPLSQALKDAAMGYSITKNLKNDYMMIHYNGAFHSNNSEGTAWYVKKYNPDLTLLVISVVEQDDLKELEKENTGAGDFIIVVDKDMTKTQQ